MRKWRALIALQICLLLIGAMACGQSGDKGDADHQLTKVVRDDLTVSVSGSGFIVVSNEAKLVFRSGGRIDKVFVEEGDEVEESSILVTLDRGPFELALAQAQADLDQAEYNLEQVIEPYSQEDIDAAEAVVDAADDFLEYAQWMLDQAEEDDTVSGIVPVEDEWEASVSRAEANLAEAKAHLEDVRDGYDIGAVEAAVSRLEASEKAIAEAQTQLDESIITAPFSGIVASINVDEGDIITAAVVIVHLIDPDSLELELEIDEIDIAEVKPGQKCIIEIDALPDLLVQGKVISISVLPEIKGGIVGYEVTTTIEAISRLRIGMSATADIITNERANVLLIPDRAIIRYGHDNTIVNVFVNGKVHERTVVTGISDGLRIEIIDGLNEGDVIVAGSRK